MCNVVKLVDLAVYVTTPTTHVISSIVALIMMQFIVTTRINTKIVHFSVRVPSSSAVTFHKNKHKNNLAGTANHGVLCCLPPNCKQSERLCKVYKVILYSCCKIESAELTDALLQVAPPPPPNTHTHSLTRTEVRHVLFVFVFARRRTSSGAARTVRDRESS